MAGDDVAGDDLADDDAAGTAALEAAFASLSQRLMALVRDPAKRVRVSLDGAGLDGLPGRLTKRGLCHRPLFKGLRPVVDRGRAVSVRSLSRPAGR